MSQDEFDLVDRPRGGLTQADREYLVGEMDMSEYDDPENVDYQRRFRIRERIKNAILDFHLVANGLPHGDVEQIFDEAYDWERQLTAARHQGDEFDQDSIPPIPPLLEAWGDALRFFYLGFGIRRPDLAKMIIETAVDDAITEYGLIYEDAYLDVDVTFEIAGEEDDAIPLDKFKERVENNNLPDDPLEVDLILTTLVRTGHLDLEEAEEIYEKQVDKD
ncbi:hypothetical protein [Halostella litorea]|uniref:hypothetical protein n=1 Tax=Halostella litorea TaxID=2528831 RepID=UPI00109223E0|nr:hypothetical protein [Halostella litorea]